MGLIHFLTISYNTHKFISHFNFLICKDTKHFYIFMFFERKVVNRL